MEESYPGGRFNVTVVCRLVLAGPDEELDMWLGQAVLSRSGMDVHSVQRVIKERAALNGRPLRCGNGRPTRATC